ncbi:MAG: lipase family protein [Deltaproteobacteria bacterium]|nr:lipase family protein [Deltaproteobacteria bacterium]
MRKTKSIPEGLGRIFPPMAEYDYFLGADLVPFPGCGAEFSLEASWWLSEAAHIAYDRPNLIRNVFRLLGFAGFRFFGNKSTEAFVAHRPGLALVVFRGTEVKSLRSLLDLYTDARFTREAFQGGHVHKGFRDGIFQIWGGGCDDPDPADTWTRKNGMGAYLERLVADDPAMRFFFTGHSLGAALATLGASLFPKATALYTFGSPRVGDRAFNDSVAVNHFRWVNNRDLVPLLPPAELMEKLVKYSYTHFGTEYRLDAAGALVPPFAGRELAAAMTGDLDRFAAAWRDTVGSGEGLKGLLDVVIGRERPQEAPLVEMLLDHAPVQYSVKIWNLLC